MKGIDVSAYQGNIDWKKVKEDGYQYAILRLGIGDNVTSQDDVKLNQNIKGCKDNDISYGFYLVSYAIRSTGKESVQSEIEHTKRLLQGTDPFCIFYDMEIDTTIYLGKETLTNFAIQYCDYFKNLGYNVGIYANKNWFTNYLNYNLLKSKGYKIWLAHYGVDKPGLECNLWQYSDKGNVSGINTNTTDLNIMYNDIRNTNSKIESSKTEYDVIYQVYSNKKKKYYSEVKNDSDFAGGSANDDNVGGIRAKLSDGTELKIQSHIINGNFLPAISSKNYKLNDIKDSNSYSGVYGKNIDGITIFSSVPLKYRVYAVGKWYGWCYTKNANTSNWNTGVAGVKGKAITRIQIAKA